MQINYSKLLICSVVASIASCNFGALRLATWAVTAPPLTEKLVAVGNVHGDAKIGSRFRLTCHGWIVNHGGKLTFVVAKYERPMTWAETQRNSDRLAPAVRSGTRFVVTRLNAVGFSQCDVYGKVDGIDGEISLNELMDYRPTKDGIGRVDSRPEYCRPI